MIMFIFSLLQSTIQTISRRLTARRVTLTHLMIQKKSQFILPVLKSILSSYILKRTNFLRQKIKIKVFYATSRKRNAQTIKT